MRLRRWVAYLAPLLLAALVSAQASAQAVLKGPVRIIVGFAAGGSSDIAARMLADKLKDSLGVPVIVENKVEQLSAIMAADTARWGPITKASGFVGD